MTDELSPAQHAIAIDASRQQFRDFVERCTDEQWQATPVDGDPRSVGVIADHIAHSYEYLAGWISDLLGGGSPVVNTDIVDELNAEHAANLSTVTQAHVLAHLKTSGDVLITLVGGLDPAQLALGDHQVRRFAVVAARHPDSHRDEIEAALQAG